MNSADGRLFDPARHERRAFMADGELRLIHHSNFQRIYGLDVAIDGLSRIRPGLRWRLDVYGDGPWRPQIEAAIQRTGTGDRVHLHGRVAMDDLPRLLAAADIGLVPSLPEPYLEYSLSTKLLEYAAMGVPTIASDLATFRHHFTDAALSLRAGRRSRCAGARRRGAGRRSRADRRHGRRRRGGRRPPTTGRSQKARYLEIVERLLTLPR